MIVARDYGFEARTVRDRLKRWLGDVTPAPVDLRYLAHGWEGRYTSSADAQTSAFEAELLAAEAAGTFELPVFQRHLWWAASKREHRILQLRDPEGRAVMQALLCVERPRRAQLLARARVYKMGPARTAQAEAIGLLCLRELTARAGDLVSLRLQPYRAAPRQLLDFEARARRAGFRLTDPVGVTRSLIFDLGLEPEELLAGVSKKTRAKIRSSRRNFEIRELDGARWTEACVNATNAAMSRTRGGVARFDFEGVLELASRAPAHAKAFGVFLTERPDELLAYVLGVRHGQVAEYALAGSLPHPELRAVPFNYWLLWELIVWARAAGARQLDLGGVTDGGPGDLRAGISSFKRRFSDEDVELGREMIANLQPARALGLELWGRLRNRPAPPLPPDPMETDA